MGSGFQAIDGVKMEISGARGAGRCHIGREGGASQNYG
jgi:hypothetical protein